ncbi:MAG: glutaredoxin [Gammaproteobacteria bacterium]|nr:MAG: glutaredoxin [Gammaproteobacteria bacterium]
MIIRAIRWLLGQLIVFVDWATRPAPPVRTPEAQAAIDAATRNLALYQFRLCPFCVKVRRAMRRLGLNIELRDALNDPRHKATLIGEGGQYKVPCLAITEDGQTRWLYESNDIIAWLEARFGKSPAITADSAQEKA